MRFKDLKLKICKIAISCFLFSLFVPDIYAQTELMAWGNMTGIRIDGQLIEFESSICIIEKGWNTINATGKEKQRRPQYIREGQTQKVETEIDKINISETVTDKSKGLVSVLLEMKSDTTINSEGIFLCFQLPEKYYSIDDISIKKNSILAYGKEQQLQINFEKDMKASVRKEATTLMLYVSIAEGKIKKGQKTQLRFTINASGNIDNSPAEIIIDSNNPGREFLGLGGNFRLQNPQVDPQVIDYCLDNLRVAYGRVEMPWSDWQPVENEDPLKAAMAGHINERVDAAMKMAQRLSVLGMPVIVSAWFPPTWAIDGDPAGYIRKGGVQAFRLNPEKAEHIYKSITDYLLCLKRQYGVEAIMFSFNESDIGIDVLHTPTEHRDFIKGLGKYMAKEGLATKMLLGDNSDATTFDFIIPSMEDLSTYPYIGAVSFHSWRGCDDETLKKWAGASRELNIPLIVWRRKYRRGCMGLPSDFCGINIRPVRDKPLHETMFYLSASIYSAMATHIRLFYTVGRRYLWL